MKNNTKIAIFSVVGVALVGAGCVGLYYMFRGGSGIGENNPNIEDSYAFKALAEALKKNADKKEELAKYEKIDCSLKDNKQIKMFDNFFAVVKEHQEEAKQFTKTQVEKSKKLLLVMQELVCHGFVMIKKDGKINVNKYEEYFIKGNDKLVALQKDKKNDDINKQVSTELLSTLKEYLTDGEKNKLYIAYKAKDDEIQKTAAPADGGKK